MLTIYEDVSQLSDSDRFTLAMTISRLEENQIKVEHFDIHEQPDAFSPAIRTLMETESLPITLLDGEVIKTGSYLTAEDAGELLIVNQLNGIGKRCSSDGCK